MTLERVYGPDTIRAQAAVSASLFLGLNVEDYMTLKRVCGPYTISLRL